METAEGSSSVAVPRLTTRHVGLSLPPCFDGGPERLDWSRRVQRRTPRPRHSSCTQPGMTHSNHHPDVPHRPNDPDAMGEREQEEQDATDKVRANESAPEPRTVVPSDPVPARPGDPKPAEIAGSRAGSPELLP